MNHSNALSHPNSLAMSAAISSRRSISLQKTNPMGDDTVTRRPCETHRFARTAQIRRARQNNDSLEEGARSLSPAPGFDPVIRFFLLGGIKMIS